MSKLFLLTISFNEEVNIEHMLKNVNKLVDDIFILDSYSTDRTIEISKKYTKNIFFRKFDNYYNQRKFLISEVLNKYNISDNDWFLILDCDETLTEELKKEIKDSIKINKYDGFFMNRKFIWKNTWIKRGGYFPLYLLRLIKVKYIDLDKKIVNEHYIAKSQKIAYLDNLFIDQNYKTLFSWIIKHIKYAKFESRIYFKKNDNVSKKIKAWNKLPLIIRPFLLFIYRVFYKMAFLDGFKAIIYHFMHAFLYRLLIDILIIFNFFRNDK